MRIAVIGAGVIGAAAAVELGRRGHQVVVFDPEPGNGASLAAAGMLAAVSESDWGHDRLHRLMREAVARYPAFVSRLEAESGCRVGHRTTATLSVVVDAADREALAELTRLHGTIGAAPERMTGSRARELEPALGPSVTSALLIAEDHQIDPRRMLSALLSLLGDRVRRERVVEAHAGDGPGIRTEAGERTDADAIVVATGLGRIDGVPALPVRPVWGDILRLRAPEALRPLLTRTVRGLVRGRPVYLVPREDGTIVLGASVREGGTAGVQAGGVLALLRDAETLLPGIAECEIVEMMARPRPGSPDAIPLIGRLEAGIVVATGFDRHGILFTPFAAGLVADLVEGSVVDEQLLADLDPLRFPGPSGRARHAHLTPSPIGDRADASAKGRP